MKAYTDIEQSKKLAEILAIESADMHYEKVYFEGKQSNWFVQLGAPVKSNDIIPCWSLAALLGILPTSTLDSSDDHHYRLHCMERYTEWYDNAIDACVAMIIKLNEQNLL